MVLSVGNCFDNLLIWAGLVHYWQWHIWVGSPELNKKAAWAWSSGSQPVNSTLHGFWTRSLLLVLVLSDGVWSARINQITPFFYKLLVAMYFVCLLFLNHSNRKVTYTISQWWSLIIMGLKKDVIIHCLTGSGNWFF